jgi:hypothetical protein
MAGGQERDRGRVTAEGEHGEAHCCRDDPGGQSNDGQVNSGACRR